MRNVVLVTIDSLRADHCGFMGYDRNTTPTLDELSADGVTFKTAIAPGPRTPQSMPALFTGSYPIGNGDGLRNRGEWTRNHLKPRETITETFKRAGYTTGGFTPNGFTSRYFGYEDGFDHFRDFIDDEYRPDRDLPNIVRGVTKWLRREEKFKPWESFYDEVITWVRSASEPYFLWIMLMDPHSPYITPREYRHFNNGWEMVYANWRSWRNDFGDPGTDASRQMLVDAYDDTIRYADAFLNHLLTDLDNPIIAVCADHGESFGEHDTYGHPHVLYEENVHVPFVIGNVRTNRTMSDPISLRDLRPILQTARTESLESLDDHLSAQSNRGAVITRAENGERLAVRTTRWKLITTAEAVRLMPNQNGEESVKLYDLKNDPSETTDKSDVYPELQNVLLKLTRQQIHNEKERRVLRKNTHQLLEEMAL